jgi:pimeloyl-ACP methyl ester carboxylesterase
MKEEAHTFGTDRSLIGILTDPPVTDHHAPRLGVIFLNSGLTHRVGPCRLYVKLARDLAQLGFYSFRMDLSGIGDSRAGTDGLPPEERCVNETLAAMECVRVARGVEKFVLLGNCSGAGAALLTARRTSRVRGTILINLQGGRVIRYFLRLALFNPKSWLRLIRGVARFESLERTVHSYMEKLFGPETRGIPGSFDAAGHVRALADEGTNVFLIYCEWDPGLDYITVTIGKTLSALRGGGHFRMDTIKGINHDFHLLSGQERLRHLIHEWADGQMAN